ncbi:hypothetical protein EHEL_091540 [Encephalitozoon hellem ATCC 50504]|uniref:Uncharacterized protein n=1 Tax=Encephalitozoon hellem TaxID=27973 RepID=A0A9Q9C7L8_ENCHE|nr:uncharacterized protein EHEL_091540 [Encephalitozoon hellem ATCC 50504]AFM99048.1 hypothetical protein EHEL_091540 [Encephalitozoon hellem ATCC 50504]UTX43467.1 hypothetical protein GPU96_07g12240 [Encephalitozoon hellem]UTX44067.1 hypothetical protein GPU96_09g18490 [Encephalitozoon hellem]UTX44266.1 hypothetical protein GPU96_10g20580 [Encephalitozoon hellem]|eukprot:XP_003888029.1 hypothetical protein EHEL_091540 [Encephalitozoon hellem ATCC 50504]
MEKVFSGPVSELWDVLLCVPERIRIKVSRGLIEELAGLAKNHFRGTCLEKVKEKLESLSRLNERKDVLDTVDGAQRAVDSIIRSLSWSDGTAGLEEADLNDVFPLVTKSCSIVDSIEYLSEGIREGSVCTGDFETKRLILTSTERVLEAYRSFFESLLKDKNLVGRLDLVEREGFIEFPNLVSDKCNGVLEYLKEKRDKLPEWIDELDVSQVARDRLKKFEECSNAVSGPIRKLLCGCRRAGKSKYKFTIAGDLLDLVLDLKDKLAGVDPDIFECSVEGILGGIQWQAPSGLFEGDFAEKKGTGAGTAIRDLYAIFAVVLCVHFILCESIKEDRLARAWSTGLYSVSAGGAMVYLLWVVGRDYSRDGMSGMDGDCRYGASGCWTCPWGFGRSGVQSATMMGIGFVTLWAQYFAGKGMG